MCECASLNYHWLAVWDSMLNRKMCSISMCENILSGDLSFAYAASVPSVSVKEAISEQCLSQHNNVSVLLPV